MAARPNLGRVARHRPQFSAAALSGGAIHNDWVGLLLSATDCCALSAGENTDSAVLSLSPGGSTHRATAKSGYCQFVGPVGRASRPQTPCRRARRPPPPTQNFLENDFAVALGARTPSIALNASQSAGPRGGCPPGCRCQAAARILVRVTPVPRVPGVPANRPGGCRPGPRRPCARCAPEHPPRGPLRSARRARKA